MPLDTASTVPTPSASAGGLSHAYATLRERSSAHWIGSIGMDFARERLHMVQMEGSLQGPRIRAAASIPYPTAPEHLLADPSGLRAFVRRALRSKPFRGNRIVTCLPPDRLKLMAMDYRVAPDQSEDAVILEQVIERLGGDNRQWVVDYIPVRVSEVAGRERSSLVAVAERERVVGFLEQLRGAGLYVDALEIGPVAIRRLFSTTGEGRNDNVLVINFGRETSYLTAISGRRLILDREIAFGEASLIEHLGRELETDPAATRRILYDFGVDPASPAAIARGADGEVIATVNEILKPAFLAMATEVSKVLVYMASQLRGTSVDGVYLLGSVARWPGAEALVTETLSLPARVFNPFFTFLSRSDGAVLKDLDPIAGIAIATGCALRGHIDDA